MLGDVRREVRETTKGRQIPWENSALEGEFYFKPVASASRSGSRRSRTGRNGTGRSCCAAARQAG